MDVFRTMARMGKKKRPSGKNKAPRKPVQFPSDWLAIARKRAGERQQPTLWYLIWLVHKDAAEGGATDFPPFPWDAQKTDAS